MKPRSVYSNYPRPSASDVLDAVERWAGEDFVLLRETSALTVSEPWANGQRMDGVLIPLSWQAPSYKRLRYRQGLCAVEVKLTRADFMAGVKRGQFEDYAQHCSGVYLAAPAYEIKPSEIPPAVGFLQIVMADRAAWYGDKWEAVCRRHPKFVAHDLTPVQCWRALWCGLARLRALRTQDQHAAYTERERVQKTIGAAVAKACGYGVSVCRRDALPLQK